MSIRTRRAEAQRAPTAADASAAAVWIAPGSLVPWAENPRKNREAIEPIARSLLRFGFGAPVVARLEDRRVIAGHTRLLAFQMCAESVYEEPAEGEENGTWRERLAEDGPFVPKGAPGPDVVPVRYVDLTETEARALSLADNKLGELAEWDPNKLREQLKLLSSTTALDGLGWSSEDLDRLLVDLDPLALPAGELFPDPAPSVGEVVVEMRIPVAVSQEAVAEVRAFSERWRDRGVVVSIA